MYSDLRPYLHIIHIGGFDNILYVMYQIGYIILYNMSAALVIMLLNKNISKVYH